MTKSDRSHLVETIFGTDGIVEADDSICFNGKCTDFESQCSQKSENVIKYFQDRLRNQLKTKANQPKRMQLVDSQWTNNNCESFNHVLKQKTDWKLKPLYDLVNTIQELS